MLAGKHDFFLGFAYGFQLYLRFLHKHLLCSPPASAWVRESDGRFHFNRLKSTSFRDTQAALEGAEDDRENVSAKYLRTETPAEARFGRNGTAERDDRTAYERTPCGERLEFQSCAQDKNRFSTSLPSLASWSRNCVDGLCRYVLIRFGRR